MMKSNELVFELYYSHRSPFARRIRILLKRFNLPHYETEVNTFEPTTAFLLSNPLGMLPTVDLYKVDPAKGLKQKFLSLPDSNTLIEFIHENYGEKIWPKDLEQRAHMRRMSTFCAGIMESAVAHYLETLRKEPDPEMLKEQIDKIERTLTVMAELPLHLMPWKENDIKLTQAGYDLVVALEYLELRLQAYEWKKEFPSFSNFLEYHRNRQDLLPTAPPKVS